MHAVHEFITVPEELNGCVSVTIHITADELSPVLILTRTTSIATGPTRTNLVDIPDVCRLFSFRFHVHATPLPQLNVESRGFRVFGRMVHGAMT